MPASHVFLDDFEIYKLPNSGRRHKKQITIRKNVPTYYSGVLPFLVISQKLCVVYLTYIVIMIDVCKFKFETTGEVRLFFTAYLRTYVNVSGITVVDEIFCPPLYRDFRDWCNSNAPRGWK
jgi:hypothetical protein